MLLVAHFYGIKSDRRLCEEVRYNLAYRWFCRLSLEDDIPDHSSLSRIRDRYGEDIFEAVFRRIVAICKEKGLVAQECHVMTDASLIAADASLNSLIHNDPEIAEKELARARYRGRSKVQIQAYLSAMAQNLKRLVFLFYLCLVARYLYPRKKQSITRIQSFINGTFSTGPVVFREIQNTVE